MTTLAMIARVVQDLAAKVREIDGRLGNLPSRFPAGSGSFAYQWGKLSGAWEPGTNYVSLTPVQRPSNKTAEPVATGARAVMVFLGFPIDGPAQWFDAETLADEPMPYVDLGPMEWSSAPSTAGFNGRLLVLVQNPLPRLTDAYQAWYQTSSDEAAPNVQARYLQAYDPA